MWGWGLPQETDKEVSVWRQHAYLCHTTHWILWWYPNEALGLKTAVTLSLLRVTANHQAPSHWGSFQMFTWRLVQAPCLTHTPAPPVPRSKPGLRDWTFSWGNLPYFFPRPLCLCLVPGRQLVHRPQNRTEIATAQGTTPGLVSEECCPCKHKYVLSMASAYAFLIHNGRGSAWSLWFVQGLL